jgi:hypothetical protein
MDIVLQTNTICMKKILGFTNSAKGKKKNQPQINNGSIASPWCPVVLYAKGASKAVRTGPL